MYFSEKFIASIDENPVESIVNACDEALKFCDRRTVTEESEGWTDIMHEVLWEASALTKSVAKKYGYKLPFDYPDYDADINANCIKLSTYLTNTRNSFNNHATKIRVISFHDHFDSMLGSTFAYEFSQGDLNRVQVLINELRDHLSQASKLDPEHKQRLLHKLEILQSELHKRVSDLDRLWGLIGEAGAVAGKLGREAKPIVDRVRELVDIAWKTQSRTEELPSDAQNPMLGHDADGDD